MDFATRSILAALRDGGRLEAKPPRGLLVIMKNGMTSRMGSGTARKMIEAGLLTSDLNLTNAGREAAAGVTL